VLAGTADELTPVAPTAPPAPAGSDGNDGLPPMTDAAGTAAVRPYADQIWMRLLDAVSQGVTDPSGAQMFGEGTDEARIWDVPSLRQLCSVPERVWMIASLRHRAAGHARPGRRRCHSSVTLLYDNTRLYDKPGGLWPRLYYS
jgi:hypothetical protein